MTSNESTKEDDKKKKEQHSLFDYITKVPTQVLIKCSTVIGEHAAQELSDQTKTIILKTTKEIATSISDSVNQVVMTVDDLLAELMIYISKSVIGGIGIRWGNGIISAVNQFGPSWEKGLTRLGDDLSAIIHRGFVKGMKKLVPQIGKSVEYLSDKIANFGKEEHAKVVREVFYREIFVSCVSMVMITLGVMMFAVSYLWNIGMFGKMWNMMKNPTVISFLFCILIVYEIVKDYESKIYNSMVC